jgi:hypothetical protein
VARSILLQHHNRQHWGGGVGLGRLGGKQGGKARAAKLIAERRREIAKKPAQARWKKKT